MSLGMGKAKTNCADLTEENHVPCRDVLRKVAMFFGAEEKGHELANEKRPKNMAKNWSCDFSMPKMLAGILELIAHQSNLLQRFGPLFFRGEKTI